MKNGDKGGRGAIQKMDKFLSSSISSDLDNLHLLDSFLSRGELEGFSCWYTATEKQLLGSQFSEDYYGHSKLGTCWLTFTLLFGLVYNLLNW